jgi:transposase InsO family protein
LQLDSALKKRFVGRVFIHRKSYRDKMVLPKDNRTGRTIRMEEKMSLNTRYAYLRQMKERYGLADRRGRARLLDEMMCVTGLSRKHLITRMNRDGPHRVPRQQQRGRTYGPEVEAVVFPAADSLGWICAERIRPVLVRTAQQLIHFGELKTTEAVLAQLTQMSLSTLRRMLTRLRPADAGWPQRRGRHKEHAIQAQVPVAVIPWRQQELGHFEVDLVHHGAADESGHVCTIQFVDVLTGWSECFAIRGSDFTAVWAGFQAFKQRCPLPVREIHSDNGSEFLNEALQTAFGEAFEATFTRGRPGFKNDNRFVEQKNSSHVRAFLGDLPLHTSAQAALLNALYQDLWLLTNLFQPVLRQTERAVIQQPNGTCRIRRTQDEAQTPMERVIHTTPPLGTAKRQHLEDLLERTNPRLLKKRISQQLEAIRQSALAPLQL